MKWLGDAYSGCTLHDSWTTVTTTGAPTALLGRPGNLSAGNAFPVVWRMLDGAWTCSTAGITVAFDCGGATGWNTYSVNTNADQSFYSCGRDFSVVFHGGTVGGTCVNYYTLATFSLKNRASLLPTVSARQVDISAGGEAGVDWANIGSPQTVQRLGCTSLFQVHSLCNSVVASITSNIKQNQALAAFEFLMTDTTNHAPSTGLTVTVTRSIDGGAFAAGTLSAVTEIGVGIYAVDFGAGDLNGKVIVLRATAALSDDTFERIVTVP